MREEPAVPFESLTGISFVMSELRLALRDPTWQAQLAAAAPQSGWPATKLRGVRETSSRSK